MEEEMVEIIQNMLDKNGIEEGGFAEYEREALECLLNSYKMQRKQISMLIDARKI